MNHTVTASASSSPRIGIFDSGLGGLSVLKAIRERLPQASLLYVADSGHAPYGERGDAYVCERSLAIAGFLRAQQAQILVVACNTATAAAVQALRQAHPDWLIVGVEPGIKPAAQLTRNGLVGVMATTGTLRSERFRLLAQAHATHLDLRLQPCPGLAAAIESGDLDSAEVQRIVSDCCKPLREQHVDTVVLGCTHYPFVATHIQTALGREVTLIDTAEAVARRTETLSQSLLPAAPADKPIQLWSSGNPDRLDMVLWRWLGLHGETERLPV